MLNSLRLLLYIIGMIELVFQELHYILVLRPGNVCAGICSFCQGTIKVLPGLLKVKTTPLEILPNIIFELILEFVFPNFGINC